MNLLTSNTTYGAHLALAKFDHFHTRDLEQARLWGASVFCQNELLSLDARSPVDAHLSYRKLASLGVGQISYGGEVTINPNQFDTFYLIQMPVRGGERIDSNGQLTYTCESVGCVLNPQHPVRVHHGSDTKKLILKVDRDLLERQCGQHLGRDMPRPVEFDTAMPLSTSTGQRWVRTMTWLIDYLNTDEIAHIPLLNVQIEQMVVSMLLTCQHSNQSEQFLDDTQKITPSYVRRAEQYLEDHACDPITVGDIAEHVGVGTRSLYNGFRKYRNTSPMLMLKEIRLTRAHEQLKKAQTGQTTVTAVAYQWGFGHLGHFTTDYKRRFGESPSKTLMR